MFRVVGVGSGNESEARGESEHYWIDVRVDVRHRQGFCLHPEMKRRRGLSLGQAVDSVVVYDVCHVYVSSACMHEVAYSDSGFASFAPWAKGRTLPWSVWTPLALVKCTILPEQPIPEKRTSLLISIGSSVRAIFSPASIPKSPHPGHQSLWTSVLRSESLSTMSQHYPRVL